MNAHTRLNYAEARCATLRRTRKGYPLGGETWKDHWAVAYNELKEARHAMRLLAPKRERRKSA